MNHFCKYTAIALLAATAWLASALEILDAKFGADQRWADTTEAFKKFKVNDDFYFGWIDGNKMAGKDPAPRVAKKMLVRYRDNDGTEKQISLEERTLNGLIANMPVSEKFTLGAAYFGDNGKFINITAKMRDLIASHKEITLDFPTLGIDPANDPVPGKRKLVVLFYSIDNQSFCKWFWEKTKFNGATIDGTPTVIPLAKEIRSPFKGKELDKAVWQWSVPVKSVVSKENDQNPTAFLYIPPQTKKLRGVVVGQFNMLERPLMENAKFREALAKLGYGCIWIAPSLFGSHFDFNDHSKGKAMQEVFDALAEVSGYRELSTIPFVGLGHSAMASFPYELALWKPERALAGISYDGSTPGIGWPHEFKNDDPLLNDKTLPKLVGIPFLIRDGQYSGGRTNRRPVIIRQHYPELALTLVSDPGSGHFDINDRIAEFIGFYLQKADKARNSDDGKLKPVKVADGWYMDFWRYNEAPKAKSAPVTAFQAFKGRYGAEANWVFDEEHARRQTEHQELNQGKKVQLLAYIQDGKILPDRKTHAQIHPAFKPEKDGVSIKLKAGFLDRVTDGRAVGWSGLKAGSPIGHGSDVENIRIQPICGPVERIDNETVAVRFDRFGFSKSRRSGEIYMMAVHPDDDTYRRSVLQSVMMIPVRNAKGLMQRIDFPAIADQKIGTKSIKLNAVSNLGMPVEYFVVHGPAYLKDNELIFTEVPAGAKLPIEVVVTAYQYGTRNKPEVQSAAPITRKFNLVK